jgi:uncharacterized protein YjbI with pentapeptide repeats
MAQIIHPPKLPKPLLSLDLKYIENQGEYIASGISGVDFTAQIASDVLFEQIHFRRVIFTQTHLTRLRLFDSCVDVSDFSGATWDNPRLRRVEFKGCRFLGMQMVEAQLEDVIFNDCIMDGVLFTSMVCKGVRFEKCVMRSAVLEESDLTGVEFRKCDLSHASLRGSILFDADLRSSILDGVQAYPKDLRGVIIEPAQAIQVVSLLGVRIMDDV